MDEEAGEDFKELIAEFTTKRNPPYVYVAHKFVGGTKDLEKLISSKKNFRNYVKKTLNPFDDTVET